jgi:hypothetical protein
MRRIRLSNTTRPEVPVNLLEEVIGRDLRATGEVVDLPEKVSSAVLRDRDGHVYLLEGTRGELATAMRTAGYVVNDQTVTKTWTEFADSGLLWWVNRSLHLFGWTLIVKTDAAGNEIGATPARCLYRGFSEAKEDEGFLKLTRHLRRSAAGLLRDLESGD